MLPRSTRPYRTRGPACALVVGVLVGLVGCTTSSPARVDGPTNAVSEAPAATTTTEPALELPDDSSTVGGVAAGFPTDLVALPPDADVLVSSAQPVPGSDLVEISLNLRTTLSADDLMDQVRDDLGDAGFDETRVADPPDDIAAESTFVRTDGEVVTVAVLDRDGVRTLTLGGRVEVA